FTSAGRLEMLPFLREQSVTMQAHRFGTLNDLPQRALGDIQFGQTPSVSPYEPAWGRRLYSRSDLFAGRKRATVPTYRQILRWPEWSRTAGCQRMCPP